jgi:hypothetical protein
MWQLRDVEREPNVQLEQAGQQFFLNVTGPHTLEPRQGRAGHSPHMVRDYAHPVNCPGPAKANTALSVACAPAYA